MDLTPVLRFALLLVRPGMVVMLAPGLGGRQIPAMARIALTVMAAVALMPTVQLPDAVGSNLVLIILREAAVGLSLAFVLQVLIAGAEFAGLLSSYQIGFSYGATDEYGYKAEVEPYSVHDIHATILQAMGLDHRKLTYYYGGRDQRLTNFGGDPILKVFA